MSFQSEHTQMEMLILLGSRLHNIQNLGDYLQEITDIAADLTMSQGSSILLFEEETQQLYFKGFIFRFACNLLSFIRQPLDNLIRQAPDQSLILDLAPVFADIEGIGHLVLVGADPRGVNVDVM